MTRESALSERVWGKVAEFFFRIGSWAEGHECVHRDRRLEPTSLARLEGHYSGPPGDDDE